MLPQPGGGRKCFPRVCQILKHKYLHYRNKQTFSLTKKCVDWKIKVKGVLIVMVPIWISKDVLGCVLSCFSCVWLLEPSYVGLKFMVQNRNYICTNLVIVLEKEMATHSSTLAWKSPWMEEHDRLQSMGSERVRRVTFTFTNSLHLLISNSHVSFSLALGNQSVLYVNKSVSVLQTGSFVPYFRFYI